MTIPPRPPVPARSTALADVPAPRQAPVGHAADARGPVEGTVLAGLAWIVREVTHVPGVLRLRHGRLSFESTRGVLFDATASDLGLELGRSPRAGMHVTVGVRAPPRLRRAAPGLCRPVPRPRRACRRPARRRRAGDRRWPRRLDLLASPARPAAGRDAAAGPGAPRVHLRPVLSGGRGPAAGPTARRGCSSAPAPGRRQRRRRSRCPRRPDRRRPRGPRRRRPSRAAVADPPGPVRRRRPGVTTPGSTGPGDAPWDAGTCATGPGATDPPTVGRPGGARRPRCRSRAARPRRDRAGAGPPARADAVPARPAAAPRACRGAAPGGRPTGAPFGGGPPGGTPPGPCPAGRDQPGRDRPARPAEDRTGRPGIGGGGPGRRGAMPGCWPGCWPGGGPGRRRTGHGTPAPMASTSGRTASCRRRADSACSAAAPWIGSGIASSSESTGAPWPRSASAAATRAWARSRGSTGRAAWSAGSMLPSRRANSRTVNVLRSARGSSSSTAERCERLTVRTRSASSTSRAGSWRARKAATSGCVASGPSWARESGCISEPTTAPVPPLATSNHDAHRGPSRISSSARVWKRANGDRQMFPVQTNRSRKRRGAPSPRPSIRPIVAVRGPPREPSDHATSVSPVSCVASFPVRTPLRRARTAPFRGVGTPVRRPVATTAPVRYSCSSGRPARRS